MKNFYELVDSNKRKTNLILIGFVLFIFIVSYIITISFGYDLSLIVTALIMSGITSLGSYYYSDKIILTISKAKPASREDFFDFYTATENLCLAAQLPMPKLYVIEDSAMNAFATGRDPEHAVVCATTGILNRLDRTELEGVIAHELSHIKNYDIRLMSIVTILVGLISLLSDWLIRINLRNTHSNDKSNYPRIILISLGMTLTILSPIIAKLIKLAISRRREFLADASAAMITKYPEGLARALEKISQDQEPLEAANKATAHLYIANPLKNHRDAIGWFANLFNTHPPIEERIKALRS